MSLWPTVGVGLARLGVEVSLGVCRGARDWFTSHKWSCSVGGLERYARVVVIAVEQRASGSQATCHKVTAWAGWSAKKHTSEDSGYYR